jgi:hypothetical protein
MTCKRFDDKLVPIWYRALNSNALHQLRYVCIYIQVVGQQEQEVEVCNPFYIWLIPGALQMSLQSLET